MKYPPLAFLGCLLALFSNAVFAQKDANLIFPEPLSPRIANYDITAELDPLERKIYGIEKLNWTNTSNDVITELQFHMYLNAFKNNQSTFMTEGGSRIGIRADDADENTWGYVDIKYIADEEDNDLSENMEYIQPDDDNEMDQTVLRVPLKKPLQPGEEINLEIKFTSKLPRLLARTGYAGDYYLVAQWFPKIGVYEYPGIRYATKGQWNCHQFHARSEFYADFGVYNVSLTLPKEYTVGATGSMVGDPRQEGAKQTWRFHAEDVIDFAWTASPRFEEIIDRWRHVKLKLYIQPEHKSLAKRYLQSAKESLEYFNNNLGKYPYPTLSIVDPSVEGIQSSGMEYPNFITGISFHNLPEGIRLVETVTVHEFGHQYFMMMLASNEFEESWLDEGFNTYYEGRCLDEYYGPKTSSIDVLGFNYGGAEGARIDYVGMNNPKIAENFRYVWEFKHGGYSDLAYNKTATWLKTLEGLVGIQTMDQIMKTYFERWKFKHPCATDFIAIVNEVVKKNHGDRFGEDMQWFFDQVLYGSDVCDYRVGAITNTKPRPKYGVFDDLDKWMSWSLAAKEKEEVDEEKEEVGPYESKVVLFRDGEVIMPQEILIHFEDGEEELILWDGKDRSFEIKRNREAKMQWVMLDPSKKIYMDRNFNDNSKTIEPNRGPIWKYASKFLVWLQNAMQSVTFLV